MDLKKNIRSFTLHITLHHVALGCTFIKLYIYFTLTNIILSIWKLFCKKSAKITSPNNYWSFGSVFFHHFYVFFFKQNMFWFIILIYMTNFWLWTTLIGWFEFNITLSNIVNNLQLSAMQYTQGMFKNVRNVYDKM